MDVKRDIDGLIDSLVKWKQKGIGYLVWDVWKDRNIYLLPPFKEIDGLIINYRIGIKLLINKLGNF